MGCFQVRYDSRVIIYDRKLFIRLATELNGGAIRYKYTYLSYLFHLYSQVDQGLLLT